MSTDATTYAHFLFNAFDSDRNGSIRFEDFVIGLSVLLRGSITEKLNWAFNLYDINKDGYITKEVRPEHYSLKTECHLQVNQRILLIIQHGSVALLPFFPAKQC